MPFEDNAFVSVPAKTEGGGAGQLTPLTPGSVGLRTKADKPSEMPCKNRGKLIERGFPVLLLPCVEKNICHKSHTVVSYTCSAQCAMWLKPL